MTLKVLEVFRGIQGEGQYAGVPSIFVRFAGCTRQCTFCDTQEVMKGKFMSFSISTFVDKIVRLRYKYPALIHCAVVFTGGEPLLFHKKILKIIDELNERYTSGMKYHLETNADLVVTKGNEVMLPELLNHFNYIAFSPKDRSVAEELSKRLRYKDMLPVDYYDVKVVTDLDRVGMDKVEYATMLMPLTTGDEKKDLEIKRRVWKYCIDKGLRYSSRLHVDVWGYKCQGK